MDPPAPRISLRALAAEEWPAYFRGIQPLWGGGLEVDLFNLYQRRLANAAESAQRYEILGLFEGARMLSAMKIYRFAGAHEGERLAFRGVGAVFTPEAQRRRGYAGHMLKLALARFRAEGAHAAILFSDIGARYYEKLGFRALESAECRLEAATLPRGRGGRPAGPGDEAQMTRALSRHREASAGLSLEREDGWALRFQLRRLRELARSRHVGEPDWGIAVESPTARGELSGAAMLRYTKDGIDILDASWDTGVARDAILGAIRDRLIRAAKSVVRVWPAHQFRGLFPSGPRTSAVAMICPLHPRAESISAGTRAELSLLDHI